MQRAMMFRIYQEIEILTLVTTSVTLLILVITRPRRRMLNPLARGMMRCDLLKRHELRGDEERRENRVISRIIEICIIIMIVTYGN